MSMKHVFLMLNKLFRFFLPSSWSWKTLIHTVSFVVKPIYFISVVFQFKWWARLFDTNRLYKNFFDRRRSVHLFPFSKLASSGDYWGTSYSWWKVVTILHTLLFMFLMSIETVSQWYQYLIEAWCLTLQKEWVCERWTGLDIDCASQNIVSNGNWR